MAQVIWSPQALNDYQCILSTIGNEAGTAAQLKWRRKIDKAVSALERLPEIGSPVEEFGIAGLREQIVNPYRIIYTVVRETCQIVRIINAKQDLEFALRFLEQP